MVGTVTYTFVAGYSYEGVRYGEHMGRGGRGADRKTLRCTQESEKRNFPPACCRNPSFGAAKRMRGCSECFEVTTDNPSVFSSPTSEHQFWQSTSRQGNFAEPLGLQYRQCRDQYHSSHFLEFPVQPLRNDTADGTCHGAGRQFFCFRQSDERWSYHGDIDSAG